MNDVTRIEDFLARKEAENIQKEPNYTKRRLGAVGIVTTVLASVVGGGALIKSAESNPGPARPATLAEALQGQELQTTYVADVFTPGVKFRTSPDVNADPDHNDAASADSNVFHTVQKGEFGLIENPVQGTVGDENWLAGTVHDENGDHTVYVDLTEVSRQGFSPQQYRLANQRIEDPQQVGPAAFDNGRFVADGAPVSTVSFVNENGLAKQLENDGYSPVAP